MPYFMSTVVYLWGRHCHSFLDSYRNLFSYLTDSHFLCSSMDSRVEKKKNNILKPANILQRKKAKKVIEFHVTVVVWLPVEGHLWQCMSGIWSVSLRTPTLLPAHCSSLSAARPCGYSDTNREHTSFDSKHTF